MNTSTIRKGFASAVAATAFFAMTACGTEVSPPSQDVGGTIDQDRKKQGPRNESGNRKDFRDEYGAAERQQKEHSPAGSGTKNRMDFGEYHGQ